MHINRPVFLKKITQAFSIYPICALIGPRQCGKTTLAHDYIHTTTQTYTFFDLEDPEHFDQLQSPKITLSPLSGLIVIDEVQRHTALFPYLRVLADYSDKKFLILGSTASHLMQQASEALTGRIDYIELTPFMLTEIHDFQKHWFWGGYPPSYLASNYEQSYQWRKNYITSFIERDLPALHLHLNPTTFRHLWHIIAHYHGQLVNYSDMARTLGISDMTIRRYTQILAETFMIRLLQPWYENISKRQVKAPKIYIRDSGFYHQALGLFEQNWLTHPKKGASFEGFVIEELIRHFGTEHEYYFWRTQSGEELDLLMIKDGKKIGFEIKYADVPTVTPSMRAALHTLQLEALYIVTFAENMYQKEDRIYCIGIYAIHKLCL